MKKFISILFIVSCLTTTSAVQSGGYEQFTIPQNQVELTHRKINTLQSKIVDLKYELQECSEYAEEVTEDLRAFLESNEYMPVSDCPAYAFNAEHMLQYREFLITLVDHFNQNDLEVPDFVIEQQLIVNEILISIGY